MAADGENQQAEEHHDDEEEHSSGSDSEGEEEEDEEVHLISNPRQNQFKCFESSLTRHRYEEVLMEDIGSSYGKKLHSRHMILCPLPDLSQNA